LARARQAFEDIEFKPAILKDVSDVSTSWKVLGKEVAFPVGIAPTGFTRMMQHEGEDAGASVAAKWGVPFTLSTMGTRSIEHVASVAPNGRNWFQLYMWKDRNRSMELVARAAKAGFDTLVVTVDVPVAGARLRDKRNGFSICLVPGGGLIFYQLIHWSLPRFPHGRAPSRSCLTSCLIRQSPTKISSG